ncbi:MAG TPA: secretion system protein E [Archaeoglobus veneficus]|nr:secretion system protein E [Archaeoglobus veneficus]
MRLKPGFYYQLLQKYLDGVDEAKILQDWRPSSYEDVIREYWIFRPLVKTVITFNRESGERTYHVVEPFLTEEEVSLLDEIFKDLEDVLILKDLSLNYEVKGAILAKSYMEILDEYGVVVSKELNAKYLYYVFRDFLGFGVIDPIMNDPYIEDIHCDGYGIPIYVYHKEFGNIRSYLAFTAEELDRYVQTLVQMCDKHISHGNPIIDATLPDGSRLQATYGVDVTPRGSSFTIRKFTEDPFTPIDLLSLGTYTAEQLAYFWMAVENKLNVMIIGETASGKTTTLNALLMFIPPEAKIVSIEDTREIALMHENWVAGVTRQAIGEEEKEIDMYDLLKTSLRQRPDYIVVGEVRGREAQTLFQAMSTGHAAYATLHAGDVQQAIYRLESKPLEVPRSLIQFLDIVAVQIQWTKEGVKKRRAKGVYEILGIDPADKNLLINEVYAWDPYVDGYRLVGSMKKLEKIAMAMGEEVEVTMEEMYRRAEYLKRLHELGIRDYKEVTRMIHAYYRNPDEDFGFIIDEGRKYGGYYEALAKNLAKERS